MNNLRDILKTGVKADFSSLQHDRYVASTNPVGKPTKPTVITPRASCWTLEIPGWMPCPLNALMDCHWGKRSALKKRDREVIGNALVVYGVPRAERKRKVTILVVFPPKQRKVDNDALLKSGLDALVMCGALVNDSDRWVDWDKPRFARGESLVTFLTLEDVA